MVNINYQIVKKHENNREPHDLLPVFVQKDVTLHLKRAPNSGRAFFQVSVIKWTGILVHGIASMGKRNRN